MKNRKGQALVEFILIIPVFTFLLFGLIDFGKIMYEKITLQNHLEVVVDLYKNNQIDEMSNYLNNEKITFEAKKDNQFIQIITTKKVNLITPGIKNLFKNPYMIKESMTIVDES